MFNDLTKKIWNTKLYYFIIWDIENFLLAMIRMVENTYEYILMHMERFRLDEQNHSSQLDKTCYDYKYDV